MVNKECTKCGGEFTWKQPYDGTKNPCGDKPCTCTPKTQKKSGFVQRQSGPTELSHDDIQDFTILWNKVYLQCSILAASVCEEGASVKDKHICTCGIVHDYFNSRK